jgi:hypothetical protein
LDPLALKFADSVCRIKTSTFVICNIWLNLLQHQNLQVRPSNLLPWSAANSTTPNISADRRWPNLVRGRCKLDCDLDVDDPASNQHDSNLATWLSTKHILIDLATKTFPCKRIENTSKKVNHAIW